MENHPFVIFDDKRVINYSFYFFVSIFPSFTQILVPQFTYLSIIHTSTLYLNKQVTAMTLYTPIFIYSYCKKYKPPIPGGLTACYFMIFEYAQVFAAKYACTLAINSCASGVSGWLLRKTYPVSKGYGESTSGI